jgi:hypothetical protein
MDLVGALATGFSRFARIGGRPTLFIPLEMPLGVRPVHHRVRIPGLAHDEEDSTRPSFRERGPALVVKPWRISRRGTSPRSLHLLVCTAIGNVLAHEFNGFDSFLFSAGRLSRRALRFRICVGRGRLVRRQCFERRGGLHRPGRCTVHPPMRRCLLLEWAVQHQQSGVEPKSRMVCRPIEPLGWAYRFARCF